MIAEEPVATKRESTSPPDVETISHSSMKTLHSLLFAFLAFPLSLPLSHGTEIREVLEPPSTPGNAFTGTFFVTPSEPVWAFGVGNDLIEDTAISGISFIDGAKARDHWISALISRASWEAGFDFDSIRPIGATPPSSFSIDTSGIPWQWGATDYVAFYWLSEAGDGSPVAVLQPGTEYDAFKFFTSGPDSPFATFNAPDGGTITTGETITDQPPEPVDVEVDVKPGSDSNPVNLKSNGRSQGKSPRAGGVLPVAILTTEDYDATVVEVDTVLLGDAGLPSAVSPVGSSIEDVDGDGDDDVLLLFSILDLTLSSAIDDETTELLLTGEDADEAAISGVDSVTIKP